LEGFIPENGNAVKLHWWFHTCSLCNTTDHLPSGAEMKRQQVV